MSTFQSRVHNRALKLNNEIHSGAKRIHDSPNKVKSLLQKHSSKTSQPIYYNTIFEKVFSKRLAYYKRVSGLLSLIVGVLLTILTPGASIFMLPIKVAFIFGSFIFIESMRELTITVEFDPSYNSFSNQIIGEILSRKFTTILLGYTVSSLCYFIVVFFQFGDLKYYITSPTRTIKPFINDEFIYFWYHVIFMALVYALQHSVFLKSKLNFKFGVAKSNPKESLFKNQVLFAKDTVLITGLITIISPITYRMLRFWIYKVFLYPFYWPLGLNHKMPLAKLSFSTIVYLIFVDAVLIYSWDLVNHVFNVYATVGCISSGKALSNLSKDPVNTLFSGLRDSKRPLVKLTALQELAYVSTSEDAKLREFLYTSQFKNTYVWQTILEECSQIIESTSKRIKAKPKILTSKLNKPTENTKPNIFGNSKSTSKKTDNDDTGHYSLKPAGLVSPTKQQRTTPFSIVKDDMEPIDFKKFTLPMLQVLNKYYLELKKSNIGAPFRVSLKKEAESRIVNPVNYGNAILSISYISLSAEFEDKKNVVISTLPEVLSLLELAVSSTKSFIDNPAVVENGNDKNLVTILHDLSLRLFFELVVKYNHMLNDFALPQSVFNLSKWCIDLAIEQQKEEELENTWA